jgi:glycosyltransferase involved in cell wall biosynthesis
MNVLVVISSAGVYGAESMVLHLLEALASQRCRPILAALRNSHHPNPELSALARQRGFEVEPIYCQGRLDLSVVRQLQQCIRKYCIDVVHAHGYKADLYTYLATRRPRVPLVATCHNWTNLNASVSFYGRLDRLALTRFDRVAAVSDTVAQILAAAGIPSDRVTVIPNGIPTALFESSGLDCMDLQRQRHTGPVVGMVGRLVREKGFAYVLRSARTILADFPTTRFLLVGDGPQADELRSLVRQEGIEESVIFAGYRSDLQHVYRMLDILVLPSFLEGMPMVILEAMAAGKPVIATRVGAIPTLITHGQDGILVDPGDTPALVDSLRLLLGDDILRRRMGAQGQALIQQGYSAKLMAQRYLGLYSQAIDLRRTKAGRITQHLEDPVDLH